MIGRQVADRDPVEQAPRPLSDEIADHPHKLGRSADGRSADHVDAEFLAEIGCFGVEVKEHLHVVGDEADWRDHELPSAGRVQCSDRVTDIGLEPGLRWRAAAALVDELPVGRARRGGDEPAGFLQLRHVAAAIGHRHRDAVGREQDGHRRPHFGGKVRECRTDMRGHRPHEARVVEEDPDLVDLRCPVPERGRRRGDVFPVLPAARVA